MIHPDNLSRRRERANSRALYRNNAEFRARTLASVKSRHERDSHDPEYRRLVRLRKRIYATREMIDGWLGKIRRAENRLMVMIRERDDLATKRKARRDHD
jgi:hypothetical protein